MTHLLKTYICIFSNTANDWQVYSGKLLQVVVQISQQSRLYIGHNIENHFEVVLANLRPNNNDINNKSGTDESLIKNSVWRELFRQIKSSYHKNQ